MAIETNTETPREETLIKETRVRVDLIELFIGDREGTPEERRELHRLKAELGDRIYPEIVYALLHKAVEDAHKARKLFESILGHKKNLEKLLGRRVSIQTAALDYLRNIGQVLHQPAIIEEEDIAELARLFVEERSTK
ncbi:MAG: hypothetical protein ACYC5N_07595, partial [Endomicrobiales bacterium]